jgi:hypothetical protein
MCSDILKLLQTIFGDSLTACVEYTCTDSNYVLLQKTTVRFSEFADILSFKILDVQKNLKEQGFSLETYGIINENSVEK